MSRNSKLKIKNEKTAHALGVGIFNFAFLIFN